MGMRMGTERARIVTIRCLASSVVLYWSLGIERGEALLQRYADILHNNQIMMNLYVNCGHSMI